MSLQLLSMDPLLCIVDGFLSIEECNAVCDLSSPGATRDEGPSLRRLLTIPLLTAPPFDLRLLRHSCVADPPSLTLHRPARPSELRRSRVTDGHVSSGRISQSTFLTGDRGQLPIVKKIEARIAELFASAECVALNTKYNGGQFAPLIGAEPIQARAAAAAARLQKKSGSEQNEECQALCSSISNERLLSPAAGVD